MSPAMTSGLTLNTHWMAPEVELPKVPDAVDAGQQKTPQAGFQ